MTYKQRPIKARKHETKMLSHKADLELIENGLTIFLSLDKNGEGKEVGIYVSETDIKGIDQVADLAKRAYSLILEHFESK